MTSADFSGGAAEAMVGEVTALRSFRLTDDGYLLPLTDAGGHEPWPTETHSAKCNRGKSHPAPDPECTCGFYAYGNRSWVQEYGPYAWSRLILAAVHCSGRLVAGEKGLRGERMRLKACYVNKTAPSEVMERLRENYPEVEFFTSRKALLKAYPETHLSTYLEAPKRPRLKPSFSILQVILALFAIPILGINLVSIFSGSASFQGQLALLLFAVLVWGPILIESVALLRTGMDPGSLAAMRRATQIPWTMKSSARAIVSPLWKFVLMGFALGLAFTVGDDPLQPFEWPNIALAFVTVATIAILWFEGRKAFPATKNFPVVPRTEAVRDLRAALPEGFALSRESLHRHQLVSSDRVIEMFDMGEYGVGMIHFDIFSDPEDYPSAVGAAQDLTWTAKTMAKEMGISRNRWIAYIASEDATLRVLTPNGIVSPPVPLAEIDAVLPLPNHSWCPPGVRRSFVSGATNADAPQESRPLALQSGYREDRPGMQEFSDPRIGNAIKIARRLAEQKAYRNFKQIEALLPDGLEPLAVPTIPDEEGGDSGSSEEAQAEMKYALLALLDTSTDMSSARGLAFAITELINACDSAPLNDIGDIGTLDEVGKPPADADQGMRGAHILLVGEIGAIIGSGLIKALAYNTPEGRVYAVILEGKKKDDVSMAMTVRRKNLEGGGDDDVDALKNADE